MYILSYIYGSYSLKLGEDIELFCVVQDFCLVTVGAGTMTVGAPCDLGAGTMTMGAPYRCCE